MEYSPAEFQCVAVTEKLPSEAESISAPAIVRRLMVTNFAVKNDTLFLEISSLRLRLTIPHNQPMVFGTETITAIEYFRRVIERNDMIDAVLLPKEDDLIPIQSFWIRIEYCGKPPAAGTYSKKDDGFLLCVPKPARRLRELLRDFYEIVSDIFFRQACVSLLATSKSATSIRRSENLTGSVWPVVLHSKLRSATRTGTSAFLTVADARSH